MSTSTVDILKLLDGSKRYTLHSHTEFCDGRAQMIAFAREAVNRGFTHYGFSPHAPVPIVSPCNMHRDNMHRYLAQVDAIIEAYADSGTQFLASLEIDCLGEECGAHLDYFAQLPLDYRISSVHFVPTREGEEIDIDGRFDSFKTKMATKFNGDLRYVVEKYYERSIEMVDRGGFDIIGHMDKISLNAGYYDPTLTSQSWYKALVQELIEHIAASGITVELNTKARAEHGRFFPDAGWLQQLLNRNIPIVVNSDAHVPALIDASRQEAFDLIDNLTAHYR